MSETNTNAPTEPVTGNMAESMGTMGLDAIEAMGVPNAVATLANKIGALEARIVAMEEKHPIILAAINLLKKWFPHEIPTIN